MKRKKPNHHIPQQAQAARPSAKASLSNFLNKFLVPVLFLAIFAIGISLRIHNLGNVPTRSPDEGVYTYQAKTVVERGAEGMKLLARQHNDSKELWIYPPPHRAGYLWVLSATMKLISSSDVKTGSYISCAFSILSLLLLVLIGWRFFNKYVALIALLFMSVSPMDLAIARRTWQDAMVGFVGLLLIYFSCEAARANRKLIWYVLFGMTGCYCILIKESGLVIYSLCVLWLLWLLIVREKDYLKGILLAAGSALSVAVSIAVLAHAVGGFPELIAIFRHWKSAIPTNDYAIQYQSGPWYRFLAGFWIVSPVSAIFCIVGIAGTFLRRDIYDKIAALPPGKDRASMLGIIFFTAAFMAVAVATPHFQNLRYVSVVFAPFYLLSGLGLWYIASFSKKVLRGGSFTVLVGCIAIAMIFASISDYNNFKKIFLRTGVMDLSIRLLEECSR